MSFAIPSHGADGQPYQFTTIPVQGTTPAKLVIKNNSSLWVFDGSTLTQVTDSDYPAATVYGVVYLDGTIYVMDSTGVIFGSDIMDPLSWSALNFIAAKSEGDAAVALVRHLSYVVAFKARSTEFFYDAGNPAPGSPLGKVPNAFMEIGCATAGSIAFTDNTVFWMSQSQEFGRSIRKMEGFGSEGVSTWYIDRILNTDDLAKVWAFCVKMNGHQFYVLTLKTSAITLVYDLGTKEWHRWTWLTANASINATATDQGYGVSLMTTASPHGLQDGDPVGIGGIVYPAIVQDSTSFLIDTSVVGTVPFVTWTEGYFPAVYSTRGEAGEFLLSEVGALVYQPSDSVGLDDGQPIDMRARTKLYDWEVMRSKRFNRLELVGDLVDSRVQVRYSDKDYQTWSQFRSILIQDDRAQVGQLGSGRRRAWEFRYLDQPALRMAALEVDFFVGAR